MKKVFFIIGVILFPIGVVLADTAYDLPDILEPTKPGKVSDGPRAFLSGDFSLYHVKGRVTGLHDGKIWIDDQGFIPSKDVKYFSEAKKKLFPSDIKVGNDAGLIFGPKGDVVQVWRIEGH